MQNTYIEITSFLGICISEITMEEFIWNAVHRFDVSLGRWPTATCNVFAGILFLYWMWPCSLTKSNYISIFHGLRVSSNSLKFANDGTSRVSVTGLSANYYQRGPDIFQFQKMSSFLLFLEIISSLDGKSRVWFFDFS